MVFVAQFCVNAFVNVAEGFARPIETWFRDTRPRYPTYCQFAVTGMVLGLGGQSKMIAKSFLKAFKIAVIIRTTCSVAINYSAVGARS